MAYKLKWLGLNPKLFVPAPTGPHTEYLQSRQMEFAKRFIAQVFLKEYHTVIIVHKNVFPEIRESKTLQTNITKVMKLNI